MSDDHSERLQKILSQAGIASRRKAEDLIREGSVTVNGRPASIGDKAVFGKDAIKVNGKLLSAKPASVYYAFYKPRGVICALEDNEGRPTIADYLAHLKTRVYPIGRMDFNSEGLLLLTNDGDIVEKIQKHGELARVYRVKVKGHPTDEMLERIRKGVKIEEPTPKFLKPHLVRRSDDYANKALIEIVVLGGGAFDVKALFEAKGFLVEKVIRHSIGQITTNGLKPGEYRPLEYSQVEAVVKQTDLALQRIERDAERQEEIEAKLREKGRLREQIDAKRPVTITFQDRREAPLKIESRPGERPSFSKPTRGGRPERERSGSGRRDRGDRPTFGNRARPSIGPAPRDGFSGRSDFGAERPQFGRGEEGTRRDGSFSGRSERVKSWGRDSERPPRTGAGYGDSERPARRSPRGPAGSTKPSTRRAGPRGTPSAAGGRSSGKPRGASAGSRAGSARSKPAASRGRPRPKR